MSQAAENRPTRRRRRRPPPAAALIAILALIMAGVGTGIAARSGHKFKGTLIKKRSTPGNRLKKNTLTDKEIKEKSLGQVPKASDATTLQGKQPPDFLSADKLKRFSVNLAFGQSQVLFGAGPFTFTAKCTQNQTDPFTDPNRDFSTILISTSQNGAVFDGDDAKRGINAADPTSFLNTDTPEDERQFLVPETIDTGMANYDAESNSDGAAFAPDGTAVAFNADGLGGSINEFGVGCTIDGFALIASG